MSKEWKAAGRLISKFAPFAGLALGLPVTGNVIGPVISEIFGVDPDPEKLVEAINADPEAQTKLKRFEEQHQSVILPMVVNGDFGKSYAQEGADLLHLPGPLKALAIFLRVIWRPLAAIAFTFAIVANVFVVCGLLFARDVEIMTAMTTMMATTGFAILLGGMFGVMGVYVHGRNKVHQERAGPPD